ncbi:MAG: hypothetical protein DHS20C02_00430 [Micavibrio sp.]|nr:MAG: hypothetical protein DHS20C02_00430 [Micavibrio sp.]
MLQVFEETTKRENAKDFGIKEAEAGTNAVCEALNENSEDTALNMAMAICLYQGGRECEVRFYCDRVLEKAPNSVQALYYKGLVFTFQAKNFSEQKDARSTFISYRFADMARQSFSKVLTLDPDHAEAKIASMELSEKVSKTLRPLSEDESRQLAEFKL